MHDDLAVVLSEVRELRAEVRRLAAAWAERPSSPTKLSTVDRAALNAMLPAIVPPGLPSALFTAAEALQHLQHAPELQPAASDVVGDFDQGAARRLSKLLARAVGVPVGGFVISRVAAERSGMLWKVMRV